MVAWFRPVSEREGSREDILDSVVPITTVNQPLSLVARVHGGPAELVVKHLPLHETPDRTTHHGHWLLRWKDQDLTNFINFNPFAEELACIYGYRGKDIVRD